MNLATIILAVIVGVLLVVASFQQGSFHTKGLKAGSKIFLDALPMIFLAFIVAGLMEILIPREFIIRWLGEEAGYKGIAIGWAAGSMAPDGPFISLAIARALYNAGAGLSVLVTYVAAWGLLELTRIPFEISFMGARFTALRFSMTVLLPPLAGLLTKAVLAARG